MPVRPVWLHTRNGKAITAVNATPSEVYHWPRAIAVRYTGQPIKKEHKFFYKTMKLLLVSIRKEVNWLEV